MLEFVFQTVQNVLCGTKYVLPMCLVSLRYDVFPRDFRHCVVVLHDHERSRAVAKRFFIVRYSLFYVVFNKYKVCFHMQIMFFFLSLLFLFNTFPVIRIVQNTCKICVDVHVVQLPKLCEVLPRKIRFK